MTKEVLDATVIAASGSSMQGHFILGPSVSSSLASLHTEFGLVRSIDCSFGLKRNDTSEVRIKGITFPERFNP